MKLSIVILNYRNKGLTVQCVEQILRHPPHFEYEIIVVDNASHDGCLERVKLISPLVRTVALMKNNGYAAGNNAGLKIARSENVMIMNPDIIIMSRTLDDCVRFLDTHPRAGLVGPKLVNPDGSLQYSCYRWPTFWLPIFRRTILGRLAFAQRLNKKYQMYDWDHQTDRVVDWMLGACFVVRAKAMYDVGLLDERYFLYVEDTDWCRRFWAAGWEVWYAAQIECVHFHERLSAQPSLFKLFKRITWVHIISWCKYFWKWRNNISNNMLTGE